MSTAITRDTLVDKFASPENLTALFTTHVPETVDLANRKWTDLVAGKTATFSYGGTNYWRVNADGSVGYTSFRGALSDGVVATASTDNYQQANNRLQFGLSLLPESDFSVEYFAKYKPLYVYDANEADKIARDESGNMRESYLEEVPVSLHVTYPIDQLGWFTSIVSLLDTTKHYWSPTTGTAYADRTHVLQRGCCRAAIKARKMFPAPKCTQMGASYVACRMAATSYSGRRTPAFAQPERSLRAFRETFI